jgi:hypothetical protein
MIIRECFTDVLVQLPIKRAGTYDRSMKIGYICPNIPDHINPMTALARHLQERNHEVVFLYSPSANGLPCVPGDKDDMNAKRPVMNGRADVFRTIVAGVAKHKSTQLVLSIGDQLDPKQIAPVPSNAIIVIRHHNWSC